MPLAPLREEPSFARYRPESSGAPPRMHARSARFSDTLAIIHRLAQCDAAVVLLEGEPGTGKTFLARELHACSPRANKPFHRVDLGTLDDSLAGSDLFGHVSGAFTGAQSRRTGHFLTANGGTLFLDEVAKASKAVQQKLLHAIEYREVYPVGAERAVRTDVRLVAATNVSLESRVAAGEFLPDLVPRFGHFRVKLPALRERRADIVELAVHFVQTHCIRYGYASAPLIDGDLASALEAAPWPGNVRELDAAMQYLLFAACGSATLTIEHCTGDLATLGTSSAGGALTAEVVRQAVEDAGSVAGAARKLRTARTTVYRYLSDDPPGDRTRSIA